METVHLISTVPIRMRWRAIMMGLVWGIVRIRLYHLAYLLNFISTSYVPILTMIPRIKMRTSRILLVKVVGNFLVVSNQTLLSMEQLSPDIIFDVIKLPAQLLVVQ